MAFDSFPLLASAALAAASLLAWWRSQPLKASARLYLRFAAVLLAALALAVPLKLAEVAAIFVLPLAGVALALSAVARFARGLRSAGATLALVGALAAGLAGMLSGLWILALMPLALSALVIVAAALNAMALIAALSGVALLAGGLATLQGAQAGALLFLAAGLIGLSRPQLLRSTSNAWRGTAVP